MIGFDGVLLPSETFENNHDEDALIKKSLLIFDKVFAIIPKSFDLPLKDPVRYYKYRYHPEELIKSNHGCYLISKYDPEKKPETIQRNERIISFLRKTEELRNNDILQILNPDDNIKSKPYYWNQDEPASFQWTLIKEKFEKIKKNMAFKDSLSYTPHLLYGNILSDLKDEKFRKIVKDHFPPHSVPIYKGQAEANWIMLIGRESGFLEDITEYDSSLGSFGMRISTPLWASLIINHALISSFRHKATPVCTNIVFQKLLNRKIEKCYSKFLDFENTIPHFKKDLRTQYLSLETLPDFELKSFDDVLEIRHRLKDEMLEFRGEMNYLANEIKVNPYSDNFSNHLEIIKRDKVNPSIRNLKKKIGQLESKTIALTLSATGISFGLLMTPIINPALLLMLGGLFSLPQIWNNYRKEYEEIKEKNGLSFLLKINN